MSTDTIVAQRILFTVGDPNNRVGFFTLSAGRGKLTAEDTVHAKELANEYGDGFISCRISYERRLGNAFGRLKTNQRIEEERFLRYVSSSTKKGNPNPTP